MNVLLVYAHPNPFSLNAQLKDHAISTLRKEGHDVQVSDLYEMKWKAVANADDFPERDRSVPLDYMSASGEAYENNVQAAGLAAEQEKLLWADAVIFQFPLWWFGFPAILKGWVDRVFAYKFAYGYKDAGNTHRYGSGILAGKRALLSLTLGGPELDYGLRGINGSLDQLLFPITHGTLFFPGLDVLPTFAIYDAGKIDEGRLAAAKKDFEHCLAGLFTVDPIPFRRQNGGDYPDKHTLAPHLAPGAAGITVHIASDQTSNPTLPEQK